jgi:hypothetical protein
MLVVFVIDPGKSSPILSHNAARGFCENVDVIKLNNQSEMRQQRRSRTFQVGSKTIAKGAEPVE